MKAKWLSLSVVLLCPYLFQFNHFWLLFYYNCPNFSPFVLCPFPTPAPTVDSHTVVHVRGLFIHVLFFLGFIFREKGREGERGRETLMCKRYINQLSLAHPNWGFGLQPRHVPWLEIKLVTLLSLQAGAQCTEPHQPGFIHVLSCSLSSPFPFFTPLSSSLLLSGHFQSVPCFHACGSI